jgi:hypothetical protein
MSIVLAGGVFEGMAISFSIVSTTRGTALEITVAIAAAATTVPVPVDLGRDR